MRQAIRFHGRELNGRRRGDGRWNLPIRSSFEHFGSVGIYPMIRREEPGKDQQLPCCCGGLRRVRSYSIPASAKSEGEVEGSGAQGILRCHFSEPVIVAPSAFQEILLQPGNLRPLETHLLAPLSTCWNSVSRLDLQEGRILRSGFPEWSIARGTRANRRRPWQVQFLLLFREVCRSMS